MTVLSAKTCSYLVDAEFNSTRTLFGILMIPYRFVSIHHTDHFILKTSRKGTDEYIIIFLYSLALIKLLRAFWKLLWLLNELGRSEGGRKY